MKTQFNLKNSKESPKVSISSKSIANSKSLKNSIKTKYHSIGTQQNQNNTNIRRRCNALLFNTTVNSVLNNNKSIKKNVKIEKKNNIRPDKTLIRSGSSLSNLRVKPICNAKGNSTVRSSSRGKINLSKANEKLINHENRGKVKNSRKSIERKSTDVRIKISATKRDSKKQNVNIIRKMKTLTNLIRKVIIKINAIQSRK